MLVFRKITETSSPSECKLHFENYINTTPPFNANERPTNERTSLKILNTNVPWNLALAKSRSEIVKKLSTHSAPLFPHNQPRGAPGIIKQRYISVQHCSTHETSLDVSTPENRGDLSKDNNTEALELGGNRKETPIGITTTPIPRALDKFFVQARATISAWPRPRAPISILSARKESRSRTVRGTNDRTLSSARVLIDWEQLGARNYRAPMETFLAPGRKRR